MSGSKIYGALPAEGAPLIFSETYIGPEGQRILYRRAGDGDRGILFVHGAGGDSRLFLQQLKFFSQEYSVFAVDLPGREGPVSVIEEYVGAIIELAWHVKADRLVIAGHSMGGALAVEAVYRNPGLFDALVLISSGGTFPSGKGLLKKLGGDREKWLVDFASRLWGMPVEVTLFEKFILERDPEIILNDLSLCAGIDVEGLPDSIDIPVLSLVSEGDEIIIPDISIEFGRKFREGKISMIPGKGHLPFIREAAAVNGEIFNFLQNVLA